MQNQSLQYFTVFLTKFRKQNQEDLDFSLKYSLKFSLCRCETAAPGNTGIKIQFYIDNFYYSMIDLTAGLGTSLCVAIGI